MGLEPGSYHVYLKVPSGRLPTTARTQLVSAAAGAPVTSVNFGSRVPPPPIPGPPFIDEYEKWQTSGIRFVSTKTPFAVRVTPPCLALSATASAIYSGTVFTNGMTNLGANTFETFFPAPGGPGSVEFIVRVNCANGSTETFRSWVVYIDPSGTILDGCTSEPLAGATVTLLKNEPFGSGTYVVPDPAEHLPSNNPEITSANGLYAWDVVPGRWRVRASKPGYDTVVTDPFDVPPPKLNLDITLMPTSGCNAPPVAKDDNHAADQATLAVAAPGVLGNDSDADGDALTAILVTDAAHGHVALAGNGSFTYTPNVGFSGSDTFTYKASDGTADSNVATVTVTVKKVNRAPVARDDAYRTLKNRPFFIASPGVLANDADPEGAVLRAALVRSPAHGFVLLIPNGAFVYLPKPGFVGVDTFTYKASDGALASNTATVTITVARKTDRDRDDDDDDGRDGDDRDGEGRRK